MNGNWFWQSSTAAWIEGKLITLMNWFWNKRHPPAVKPSKNELKSNEIQKENTTKKGITKKAPSKKKSEWSVKE